MRVAADSNGVIVWAWELCGGGTVRAGFTCQRPRRDSRGQVRPGKEVVDAVGQRRVDRGGDLECTRTQCDAVVMSEERKRLAKVNRGFAGELWHA